jgi:2-polyprenyl-3-methyl-5-hydroxy-6-metoxy-1,4-benzoquinol methylase
MRLYEDPPIAAYEGVDYQFTEGFRTYAEYNYLRSGLAARIKKSHFEAALRLTQAHFGTCSVIDFGCADGIFLPSLSKYFDHVVGIDTVPGFARISEHIKDHLDLSNVIVLCNQERSLSDLKGELPEGDYKLLFLLEVLEHVGEKDRLYESKIDFLRDAAALIYRDGLIVVSVPRMVGMPFLVQRFALWLMRLKREPMSLSEFLQAGFLGRTDRLERRWSGGHLGFNHRKLEKHLGRAFRIERKKNLAFQVLYLLRSRSGGIPITP